MLVLFLDIDGVLNSWQSIHYFKYCGARGIELKKHGYHNYCPLAVSNLNCLMEEYPSLKIVISSTWRKHNTLIGIQEVLTQNHFLYSDRVIGKTGVLDGCRGDEIKEYVDKWPDIEEFIILDDDSDMNKVIDHLIQTDQRVGFDFIAFHKAVEYFESKGFKPTGKTGVCAL